MAKAVNENIAKIKEVIEKQEEQLNLKSGGSDYLFAFLVILLFFCDCLLSA